MSLTKTSKVDKRMRRQGGEKGAARTTLHSIRFDLNVGISTYICKGDRKTIKMKRRANKLKAPCKRDGKKKTEMEGETRHIGQRNSEIS